MHMYFNFLPGERKEIYRRGNDSTKAQWICKFEELSALFMVKPYKPQHYLSMKLYLPMEYIFWYYQFTPMPNTNDLLDLSLKTCWTWYRPPDGLKTHLQKADRLLPCYSSRLSLIRTFILCSWHDGWRKQSS